MVQEKLLMIQKSLFVPKGQTNQYGGYNYRSCEDILKAVKPICESQRCVLLLDSQVTERNGKNYIEATARLFDLDDGSELTSTASAREDDMQKGMTGSQLSGSCLSYARKYALAGLFCIDNEKDADATNKHGKEESPLDIAKVKTEVLKKLEELEGKTEGYIKNVCEHYGVKSPAQLTPEQCQDLKQTWAKKKG